MIVALTGLPQGTGQRIDPALRPRPPEHSHAGDAGAPDVMGRIAKIGQAVGESSGGARSLHRCKGGEERAKLALALREAIADLPDRIVARPLGTQSTDRPEGVGAQRAREGPDSGKEGKRLSV